MPKTAFLYFTLHLLEKVGRGATAPQPLDSAAHMWVTDNEGSVYKMSDPFGT